LSNSKDYIDISISNSLSYNNRKLRRKLEVILEKSGFSSVDYIDDIVLGTEEQEKDDVVEFDESSMDISIQLDYGDYIKDIL
jgi:hypothetical protein